MQNKGEMAQQLFDIIIGGEFEALKNLHAPKKSGATAKIRAAALAKIRTAPGPAPQRKRAVAGKRSPTNTPDLLPASHSSNPPTLNLRRSRARGEEITEEEDSYSSTEEGSYSEDEDEDQEDQDERAPRQQPVFIRAAQQMAAQQMAAQHAAVAKASAAAAMQMQPPPRPQQQQRQQQQHHQQQHQQQHHQQQHQQQRQQRQNVYVQPAATRMTGRTNVAVAESIMQHEAPVLIDADQIMLAPTVPSGVSLSNERGMDINMADPSLGCHALGLARRGSFEIVKLNDKARMAARFMPRNCSIQNLTVMEEETKIESGTDWTDMAGVASGMGGGAGGMMRNPSSLQLTELVGR